MSCDNWRTEYEGTYLSYHRSWAAHLTENKMAVIPTLPHISPVQRSGRNTRDIGRGIRDNMILKRHHGFNSERAVF